MIDCVIVGGGPAGLTAALYLARFRRSVRIFDAGGGRAALIPCSRNQPAFPNGISGKALLERMRSHLGPYQVIVEPGSVAHAVKAAEGFVVKAGAEEIATRAILLATGVSDRRPAMSEAFHAAALAAGRLRYCPICDGYEVIDRKIAVIGTGAHAVRETRFLKSYSPSITVVAPDGPHALNAEDRAALAAMNVAAIDGPVRDFAFDDEGLTFSVPGARLQVDTAYLTMGFDIRSGLARALGADCADDGCIKTNAHQMSTVEGLYAAGDVVAGLDQIDHALGQGAVAATAIRNAAAALASDLSA